MLVEHPRTLLKDNAAVVQNRGPTKSTRAVYSGSRGIYPEINSYLTMDFRDNCKLVRLLNLQHLLM